jgi:hypothetical protein
MKEISHMNAFGIELPPPTANELALEADITNLVDLLAVLEGDDTLADQVRTATLRLAALVKNRSANQILRIEHERLSA